MNENTMGLVNSPTTHLGGKLPITIREWISKEFGSVRTLIVNNKVWLVGIDIAKILGYSSPSVAVNQNLKPKYKWVITPNIYKALINSNTMNLDNSKISAGVTLTQTQSVQISSDLFMREDTKPFPLRGLTFIDLSGLYSLVLKSYAPNAQPFQDWVVEELIPAVYEYGAYMTTETINYLDNNPTQMNELILDLKNFKHHIQKLEKSMSEMKIALKGAEKDVKFVKNVLQSDELLPTVVIAKDYGQSSQKFNQLLKELGVHYYQGGRWLLTAKYAELGWKHSYTYEHQLEKGVNLVITQTKWTHKGRRELTELLATKNIYPINPTTK